MSTDRGAEVFLPGTVTARGLQRATDTRVLEATLPGKSGPVHSPSCLGGGEWEVEKQAGPGSGSWGSQGWPMTPELTEKRRPERPHP